MEGDIPKRESFTVILKNNVVNLGQPMVLKITSVDATGVGTVSSSMGRWEYRKKEFFVFKKTIQLENSGFSYDFLQFIIEIAWLILHSSNVLLNGTVISLDDWSPYGGGYMSFLLKKMLFFHW